MRRKSSLLPPKTWFPNNHHDKREDCSNSDSHASSKEQARSYQATLHQILPNRIQRPLYPWLGIYSRSPLRPRSQHRRKIKPNIRFLRHGLLCLFTIFPILQVQCRHSIRHREQAPRIPCPRIPPIHHILPPRRHHNRIRPNLRAPRSGPFRTRLGSQPHRHHSHAGLQPPVRRLGRNRTIPRSTLQPALHNHGLRMGRRRSHPLLLLRRQPPRQRALPSPLPALHCILGFISPWRVFRGFLELCHSPQLFPHAQLVVMGQGHVEADRLCSRRALLDLVACSVCHDELYGQAAKQGPAPQQGPQVELNS